MKCIKQSEKNCPHLYCGECLLGFCYAMIDGIETLLKSIAETELKILNALTAMNLLPRQTQSTPEQGKHEPELDPTPIPEFDARQLPEPEHPQQRKKPGRPRR